MPMRVSKRLVGTHFDCLFLRYYARFSLLQSCRLPLPPSVPYTAIPASLTLGLARSYIVVAIPSDLWYPASCHWGLLL